MNFFTGIIIGLIAGWLVKWIVGQFVGQHNDEQAHSKLAEAKVEIEQLKAKATEQEQLLSRLAGTKIRISQLKAELADYKHIQEKLVAAEAEIEQLRIQLADDQQKINRLAAAEAAVAAVFNGASRVEDRLEKIYGIGPTFARRFNNAGIKTFAELSKVPPERAKEIVKAYDWQKIDPESWITQAKKLAAGFNGNSTTNI